MARPHVVDRTLPWSWLLASPVFVGSVLLLAVNDQVLKHEFPGLVTGKLSDVAGVVMIAMALTALIGRPRAACAGAAGAFTALKTLGFVADAAVPVLGGRTLTDATDLIALVALPPLAVWMRRHHDMPDAPSSRHRLSLKVIAIGAAALATSATSCDEVGIQVVRVDGSQILALDADGEFFASPDGTTWTAQDPADRPPTDANATLNRSCAGGVCFEIVERRIERQEDSVIIVEFELSDTEVASLIEEFRDDCSSSSDLLGTIAAIETPNGIVAVASMGELGVLFRSADGVWSAADVGDNTTGGRTGGGGWAPLLAFVLILLLAFVSIPIGFLAHRSGRSVLGYVVGNLGAVLALFFLASFVLLVESFGTTTGFEIALWIPFQIVAIGFGALMLYLAGRARPTTTSQPPPPAPVDRRD